MKNWKLYNEGERVVITNSHTKEDIGKQGVIISRRNSFCRIKLDSNKEKNFTYAQFKHQN